MHCANSYGLTSAIPIKMLLRTEATTKKFTIRMTALRLTTRALTVEKTRNRACPFRRLSSSLWIKSEMLRRVQRRPVLIGPFDGRLVPPLGV